MNIIRFCQQATNFYRVRLYLSYFGFGIFILALLFSSTSAGLALSMNEKYALAPVSGSWNGLTSLGYQVSFTVNPAGTQWTNFKVTTRYVNGGCSVLVTSTAFGPGAITNNHFSFSGSTLSFSGNFTSATVATGTFTFTNVITGCGTFSQTGTWNASGTATLLSITGNAGIGGATLNYVNGTVTADNNGNYSITVPAGWSGSVTPFKIGYTFVPSSRSYTNIQANQTSQNYTAQVIVLSTDTTGVFRPSNGALYLKNSNTSGFADIAINYGLAGDYPVTGDWNGDGVDTIGIYRNGYFYLRNSNTIGVADLTFPFGSPGDQPVAGDWNGDGMDTIGVYRSSTGTFYLRNSNTPGNPDMIFSLGVPGDVGIAGDWTGKGFDTTGVFRPSNGALYLKNKNETGIADIQINYGLPGDKPVTGDWNDDGIDTIGIYRNGVFYLRNSNTIGYADIVFALGMPGDTPIAGNWDGKP